MTRPALKVVRAGAGSGKTYSICEEIAGQVVEGLDPARVLATTFTRRAAAELKGRVQARVRGEERLPYDERLRLAERLELAMIGTVHSVGHRLVRRYALRLGLSPSLEVIDEKAANRRLRRLLGDVPAGDSWAALLPAARRLSLDKDLHDLVLGLLDAKRTNGVDARAFEADMQASAARVKALLLGSGVLESPPADTLYRLADEALACVAAVPDETRVTATARTKLRRLASRTSGPWGDHVPVAKLHAGKTSGADACLAELRAFAARVRWNTALHADVDAFVAGLTERVLDLETAYAAFKQDRGLLDYNDLEVLFLRLLEDEGLRTDLAEELRLVVVDEFQDTNPIQLAIFLRLREVAGRSMWVGDAKQAIFGFRGADAGLVEAAWSAVDDAEAATLPSNYRSVAGLVQVVGELFAPVCGDEARLEPQREGTADVVERWVLHTKNKGQDASAVTEGVRTLLEDGTPAGDVAILVRSHRRAREVAEGLTEAGVSALVERPGLLGTRECAAAVAGLRLAADRYDGVAAATLLTVAEDPAVETPGWLEQRLREVAAAKAEAATDDLPQPPFAGDASLAGLEDLDVRHADPVATLEAVVEVLGLGNRIAAWGQPTRRAANLDALVDLARTYEQDAGELGRAATLTGLLAYFDALPGDDKDSFPMPSGLDAVTVVTYHAAKGLEWPTVVLLDLDARRDADMWSPVASGGAVAEGRPLDGRSLRYWPWPFGRNPLSKALTTGSRLELDALASPEGVDAGVAHQAEELRLLYVGMTRARDRLVFVHRKGKCAWPEALLPTWPTVVGCHDDAGSWPLAGTDATMRVRHLTAPDEEAAVVEASAAATARWFAPSDASPCPVVPRTSTPSAAPSVATAPPLAPEALPGAHPFSTAVRTDAWDDLGSAVHAYLAALPSLRDAAPDVRAAVALRCLKAYAVEGQLPHEAIVRAGERLEAWVASRWPEATWRVEVPVRGTRAAGGDWSGQVDLLLLQPGGDAILVDHKTAPLPETMWASKAREYTGQLAAYTEALASAGISVAEQWVHLPLGGGVVRVGS